MNYIYFIVLLLSVYFINPLKNEEKLFTTPFLTVSYIVVFSYILSILNISMYKFLYMLPLLIFLIYKITSKKFNIEEIFNFEFKKSYGVLFLILLFATIVGYSLFPSNPANTTDTQFHSYKTKAMIEEKTIFYKTNEVPYKYYVQYPAGFHSMIYFLSSSACDILNSIQFMKFYMLILFVLGYYLVGESIKKGLGCWIALFLPLTNVVYRIIGVLLPNTLGYAMMLAGMYFVLQYRNTKNNIYLMLFSFTVISLVYIHTFPLIMLVLFLTSVSICDIVQYGLGAKNLITYWLSFILSIIFAVSIIYSKMAKNIVSYGESKNFMSEPIYVVVHNILAGMGIIYLYVLASNSKIGMLDNLNTFFISLIFTLLLIIGIFRIFIGFNIDKCSYENSISNINKINKKICEVKKLNVSKSDKINNGTPFVVLLILLIFNIINIKFIHIPIPFFSNQYDSARMAIHIQIIMPIFYGIGLYSLYNMMMKYIKNIKNVKVRKLGISLFITMVLVFSIFSAYTNYTILHNAHKHNYVITQNDLYIFNYMNSNNISNQTILNFGEDAAQFLPIYTKNRPVFCYYNFSSGHDKLLGNISLQNITSAIDAKNYKFIIGLCKKENISYIYMSDYLGKYDNGFFDNTSYFKIVCKKGHAKLIKVKN